MKAVLLCAGFGTRLYPLTRDTAKPLLEVAGKPIVEHLVEQLRRTSRIDEIIFVSNARFFIQFESWAADASKRYPEIVFEVLNDGAADNDHRLGTVRDLAFAVDQTNLREAALVAAADNLYDTSFAAFFEDYDANPRNLILAYRETDPRKLRRTGVVETDEGGRLLRFWEKPEAPPTDLACPAFYILEAAALAQLQTYLAEVPDADAIGHFIAWLVERRPVFVHRMKGRRLDIGNLDNFRAAESWFRGAGDDG
jgi:glucose-1-phosphate thymidylyltransferase